METVKVTTDTLIYDLETKTFGKPDPSKDIMRIFACYSYMKDKTYLLTNKDQAQTIIRAHKFLVGFNSHEYDNPIMIREGLDIKYKMLIDLRKIFKSRASQMKIKKGMLGDLLMEYSLDYITRTLDIVTEEEAKLKIDYGLFRLDTWTPEQRKEIAEYTRRDIEVTKTLYEWVENYFSGFKPFISQKDVNKKVHLTASIAKFAYKAICFAMKWSEEYGTDNADDEKIGGGYVAYPSGEIHEGLIYCLDFNSLYPHIMIMCNLYGEVRNPEDIPNAWNGSGVWNVQGYYDTKELAGVCKLLIKWYLDRVQYKADGDRREYTIKIILNTIYGILNNPYYLRTYNRVAGGDCTRIGRQWTKYARKVFRDHGYEVIYTDTDSVYIKDPFDDKEKMLSVKQKIIDHILASVPFPQQDTFDMGIDDEIKYMFFFKGQNKDDKDSDTEMDEQDFIDKPKGLMKKNYIYVKRDGEVIIKNLGIKKKSISALSKKIFWEKLVPEIKQGNIKFSKAQIKQWMDDYLREDIKLAFMRKEVGTYEQYAKKSPNCTAAQITKKYGPGIHFIIPNKKMIGIGKSKDKRSCTYEEFKAHKMTNNDIDRDGFWKELHYFIKPVVEKNIFEY